MVVTRTDKGDETILTLNGALDAGTTPQFKEVADKVKAEGRKEVVIEASSLRLIDSTGVGAIVALFKGVRAYGGKMTFRGVRDQPRAIFRLLRLDKVFNI